MEKITSLSNRDELRRLRAALDEALAPLGAELGLDLKMGTGRYDPDGDRMSFKVEAMLVGAEPEIAKEWRKMGEFLGPDFTGKEVEERQEITIGVTRYRICGLKRRARKRPVVCENTKDGTRYVFEVEAVARGLQAERTAKAS